MIFRPQTLATRLKRALWLASALILLEVSGASANGQFSIDNVAAIAKKMAAESFKPPQPIPEYLKQINYDDYRDIRFDPEQSLWKETEGNATRESPQISGRQNTKQELARKSLREGPASLTPVERAHLLRDAESMAAVHRALWQINPASEPPLAETQQRSTVPVLEPLQQSDSDEPVDDRADLSQTGAHWQTT
jgi:glucan biosynthesis protein MdoG